MCKDPLSILQRSLADALTEWRSAGGPVEDVVLAIQRLSLSDMSYVLTPERVSKEDV